MFAIIGMSPGNGYFKQEVINQILAKAINEYPFIGIFIPDVPAIATYKALGYDDTRARKDKAIPQGNALRNKVQRVIETENLDISKIKIFDWVGEKIEDNPLYREKFDYIMNLYNENPAFKTIVDDTTKSVLVDNAFRKIDITQNQIEIGTHYLLSEFAFMLFVGEYTNEEDVGYVYHNPWPVFENFIAGMYDGIKKEHIHFILFPKFS
jgi:cyclo(L-tyrosyl-L-tyrosyl) synthase